MRDAGERSGDIGRPHLVAKVDGVRAQLLLLRSDARQAERLESAARGYSLCIASPNPSPNPDLDEEAGP